MAKMKITLLDVLALDICNGYREARKRLKYFNNEYFSDYPEKAKIYESSCTQAASDMMECLGIPQTEKYDFVYNSLVDHFEKEIDGFFKGQPNWYGIKDIYFKWHGEWSDAEIEYKGHAMNEHTIEDAFVEMYRDECEEEGIEPDEEGEGFVKFMQDHEEEIKEWMIFDGCPEY